MVFWFRTMYMVCSFPFLLLAIPGLKLVATHAKRTGYTRAGMCVPHILRKRPFEERAAFKYK